jgi:hypothetical protein
MVVGRRMFRKMNWTECSYARLHFVEEEALFIDEDLEIL